MDANVDLYCVAAEETKARLVARGADAAQVLATGIPISAKFSSRIDKAVVRKQYGLRDDLPILPRSQRWFRHGARCRNSRRARPNRAARFKASSSRAATSSFAAN